MFKSSSQQLWAAYHRGLVQQDARIVAADNLRLEAAAAELYPLSGPSIPVSQPGAGSIRQPELVAQ